MYDSPFFRKFPQTRASFVDDHGNELSYLFPTFIAGARGMMGFFTCSLSKAAEALPGRRLVPIPLAHRGLVAVGAFEYNFVQGMEPYREVLFGIPALHLRKGAILPQMGIHIKRLIVDRPENVQRGRHLWGMDKSLGEMDFFDRGADRVCEVRRNGRMALRLVIPSKGRSRKFESCNTLITEKQGLILHSRSCMAGRRVDNLDQGKMELGADPFAAELDSLGVGSAPLLARFLPNLEMAMALPGQSEEI